MTPMDLAARDASSVPEKKFDPRASRQLTGGHDIERRIPMYAKPNGRADSTSMTGQQATS
jgi:hypothetical protein